MAITGIQDIQDFHDVVRLLETHPEWRTELRRLILTDELLALPQEMVRLTTHVNQLTEQMSTLTEVVQSLGADVGMLKGHDLERQYQTKRRHTFGRLLRRLHILSEEELDHVLHEAEERGVLSAAENEEIALADLVVRGRLRTTGEDVYLVVEVSYGVGRHDVERAATRAALLSKTGVIALPAVAGEWITPEARHLALELHVWQFTPSEVVPPASEH